jgi:hypothetical protein
LALCALDSGGDFGLHLGFVARLTLASNEKFPTVLTQNITQKPESLPDQIFLYFSLINPCRTA